MVENILFLGKSVIYKNVDPPASFNFEIFNNNNHIDNVHIKYSTQISTNVTNVMNSLLTQTLAVIY